MKILLLSLNDLDITPYFKNYILEGYSNEYDCLYVDKFNNRNNHEFFEEAYVINHDVPIAKRIIQYKIQLRKLLKKKSYDYIIILHSQLSVILFDQLINFNGELILDIRDYVNEDNKLYYFIQKKIIDKSIVTVISSQGFKNFLPQRDYLVTHNINNNYQTKSVPVKKDNRFSKKKKGIVIGQIGFIRFYALNKKLIDIFHKDDRFCLAYYGSGANELHHYNNRVLGSDYFKPSETIAMYKDIDLINNLYGYNDKKVQYALSNKLYLSAQLNIPIVVSPHTYMEKIINDYNIGFVFDHNARNINEEIDTLYNNFLEMDWNKYEKNCDKFLQDVREKNNKYEETIKYLLGDSNENSTY